MLFQASLIYSIGRFQGSLSTDDAGVNYQANPSDGLYTSRWALSSCIPQQGEVAIQSCNHLSVLQMLDKLPEEASLCHSLSFLVREFAERFSLWSLHWTFLKTLETTTPRILRWAWNLLPSTSKMTSTNGSQGLEKSINSVDKVFSAIR